MVRQLVPADNHDWDLTHASPLYRPTIGGRERNMIGTVGKDGCCACSIARHSARSSRRR